METKAWLKPLHCTNCQNVTNKLHAVSWHYSSEVEMLGSKPEHQRLWHIHDNRLCSPCYNDFLEFPINRTALYKKIMESKGETND